MTKTWVDEIILDPQAFEKWRDKPLREVIEIYYDATGEPVDISDEDPYSNLMDFDTLPPMTREFVKPLRNDFHKKPFLPVDCVDKWKAACYRFLSVVFYCLKVDRENT